jgi:PAS domain S-box-containing protein
MVASARAHVQMTIDFEKHLRETQRLTHIGSWEWDMASDTLTWTEEHYRIFGLTPEQFTPTFRNAIRYVHADDVSRIEEVVARCVSSGVAFSCEYRVLRADGTVRTVFARGTRTEDASGISTLYGTVQDITERNHAEDVALDLSPQERRALALVAQGKTNKEIAAAMKLSPKTVKNYLSRVFEKLQVAGRAEAVSRMLRGKHK